MKNVTDKEALRYHQEKAESLLTSARRPNTTDTQVGHFLAAAQVHATLAVSYATRVGARTSWRNDVDE